MENYSVKEKHVNKDNSHVCNSKNSEFYLSNGMEEGFNLHAKKNV